MAVVFGRSGLEKQQVLHSRGSECRGKGENEVEYEQYFWEEDQFLVRKIFADGAYELIERLE